MTQQRFTLARHPSLEHEFVLATPHSLQFLRTALQQSSDQQGNGHQQLPWSVDLYAEVSLSSFLNPQRDNSAVGVGALSVSPDEVSRLCVVSLDDNNLLAVRPRPSAHPQQWTGMSRYASRDEEDPWASPNRSEMTSEWAHAEERADGVPEVSTIHSTQNVNDKILCSTFVGSKLGGYGGGGGGGGGGLIAIGTELGTVELLDIGYQQHMSASPPPATAAAGRRTFRNVFSDDDDDEDGTNNNGTRGRAKIIQSVQLPGRVTVLESLPYCTLQLAVTKSVSSYFMAQSLPSVPSFGTSPPMLGSSTTTNTYSSPKSIPTVLSSASMATASPSLFTMRIQDLRVPNMGGIRIFPSGDSQSSSCTQQPSTQIRLYAEHVAVHPFLPYVGTCGTKAASNCTPSSRGHQHSHAKHREIVQLWDVRQTNTPVHQIRANCPPHVSLTWQPTTEPVLLGLNRYDVRLWKFHDSRPGVDSLESGTEGGTEDYIPGARWGQGSAASSESDALRNVARSRSNGANVARGGTATVFVSRSSLQQHQSPSVPTPASTSPPTTGLAAAPCGISQVAWLTSASCSSSNPPKHPQSSADQKDKEELLAEMGSLANEPCILTVDDEGHACVSSIHAGTLFTNIAPATDLHHGCRHSVVLCARGNNVWLQRVAVDPPRGGAAQVGHGAIRSTKSGDMTLPTTPLLPSTIHPASLPLNDRNPSLPAGKSSDQPKKFRAEIGLFHQGSWHLPRSLDDCDVWYDVIQERLRTQSVLFSDSDGAAVPPPERHPNYFTADCNVAARTLLVRRELHGYFLFRYVRLLRVYQNEKRIPMSRVPSGLIPLILGAQGQSSDPCKHISPVSAGDGTQQEEQQHGSAVIEGGLVCSELYCGQAGPTHDPLRRFILETMAWLPHRDDATPSAGQQSCASCSSVPQLPKDQLTGLDFAGDTSSHKEALERRVAIWIILQQYDAAVQMLRRYSELCMAYAPLAAIIGAHSAHLVRPTQASNRGGAGETQVEAGSIPKSASTGALPSTSGGMFQQPAAASSTSNSFASAPPTAILHKELRFNENAVMALEASVGYWMRVALSLLMLQQRARATDTVTDLNRFAMHLLFSEEAAQRLLKLQPSLGQHYFGADQSPDRTLCRKLPPLPLTDRIAFAAAVMPSNTHLNSVYQALLSECGEFSPLAPLLVGFGDSGLSHMQCYIDCTGDVQLACCLFAPYYSKKHAVWSTWNRHYSTLLNDQSLYQQRAKHDTVVRREQRRHAESLGLATPMSASNGSAASAQRLPPPNGARYVEVKCSCGQSLHESAQLRHTLMQSSSSTGYSSGSSRLVPQANQADLRKFAGGCPNEQCRQGQLPHCAVCTKRIDGRGIDVHCREKWFAWCTACLHGGHWEHLSAWFAKHKKCPVDDCYCECEGAH